MHSIAVRFGSRVAALSLAAFVSLAAILSSVAAQEDLFSGLKTGKKAGGDPLQIEAALTREKPGAPVILAVTVRLPKEHYILSTTDKSAVRTKIQVTPSDGLETIDDDFIPDRKPKAEFVKELNVEQEKFVETVTWFRRYRLAEGVDPESVSITGGLTGQYCGPEECVPIRPARKFEATLTTAVPVRRLPAALADDAGDATATATDEAGSTKAAGPLTALPLTLTDRPQIAKKPGPAELTFSLSPEKAAAGETVLLSIRMTLDGDYHTYSMTMAEGQAAIPTRLLLGTPVGLRAKSAIAATQAPEKKTIEVGRDTLRQEVHHGEVEWTQEFTVTEEGADGFGLWGKLQYQTCTGSNCLPPKPFVFALGVVPEDALKQADGMKPPAKVKGEAPRAVAGEPGAPANDPAGEAGAKDEPAAAGIPGADQGLWAFLLTAVVAGFAALLTPCVFPMVPITVSFFLKQSESKHHRPLPMALLYCGGIIGTFTILGLLMAAVFGATSLNTLANNPWLNIALAGVMVFFGLNLLGMFEIRVPYQLLTWTSGHEGKGGVIGVLFMALTFTLVSFTCTFAFCGLLLAVAAKGQYWWPILGMLAFSAAFSSPFFFLALFPSLLKKIPKSGGWMNTVKVTMGMLELGAALKFFSVADLALNPEPMLFDYAMTMLGWTVISFATGAYLLGLFRFPHDTKSESISVVRFATAGLFLLLGGFLSMGLFAPQPPGGKLWEVVEAFAPPRLNTGAGSSAGDDHRNATAATDSDSGEPIDLGPYVKHHGLKFALDYERAIQVAKELNRPLLFDFTGVNCVNCRVMEKRMAQPHNRERLQNFVLVQLYTDNIPGLSDADAVDRLLKKNRAYQEDVFDDVTLPAYLVLTPDGQFLAKFKGLEPKRGQFARFLDEGLAKWSKIATKPSGVRVGLGPTIDLYGARFALDPDRALRAARERGQPVLMYFNGFADNFQRLADHHLSGTPERRDSLSRFVCSHPCVDELTHIVDAREAERLARRSQDLQERLLQDVTVPALAVLSPEGTVIARYQGLQRREGDYQRFLDDAWGQWQANAEGVGKGTVRAGGAARGEGPVRLTSAGRSAAP